MALSIGANLDYVDLNVAEDELLMRRYRAGDTEAFAVLYERHRAPLFRFVYRSVNNQAIAEELFQEIWIKLIDARHRYKVTARFQTYLYRIAQNRLIDYYRSCRQQTSLDAETAPELRDDNAAEGFASAAASEGEQALAQAIATLPMDQRTALLLQAERGMTLDEIAQLCGVGRETIKSRLRYAMTKLRNTINPIHLEVFNEETGDSREQYHV